MTRKWTKTETLAEATRMVDELVAKGYTFDKDIFTKEQAMSQPATIYHRWKRNRDREGTALRVRSTGKCQVWKTRPDEFKLPVKYGMYESGYITHADAHEWSLVEPLHNKLTVVKPDPKEFEAFMAADKRRHPNRY